MSVYGVIMAGGHGERLWPLSRKKTPKYALHLPGLGKSMLEEAVLRFKGIAGAGNIFIVTSSSCERSVKRQLPFLKANIISEPKSKNTAPAIGFSTAILSNMDNNAVIVVMPADQMVKEKALIKKALKQAIAFAQRNEAIVTIGIKPDYPATGYGYLKAAKYINRGVFKVSNFIEKPDFKKARKIIKDKKYFWNSGIFVFKAHVMLDEIKKFMPAFYKDLKSVKTVKNKKHFLKLAKKIYKKVNNISIDFAVMEKTQKAYMVNSDVTWHDIGSWKSYYDLLSKDKNGNFSYGKNISSGCENTLVINKSRNMIAAMGLNNIVIVHEKNSILVCDKNSSEQLKKMVSIIKKKKLKRFL